MRITPARAPRVLVGQSRPPGTFRDSYGIRILTDLRHYVPTVSGQPAGGVTKGQQVESIDAAPIQDSTTESQ